MIEPTPTITLTPARLSFVLGLVGLLTIGWQSASYVQAQSYRLETVERYVVDDKKATAKMLEQIDRLTQAVTRLSVVIEGITPERPEQRP